jgi:hypothetical protein
MNLSDDLKRLNHLHREIRREVYADDRDDKRLWDFLERLAAESPDAPE